MPRDLGAEAAADQRKKDIARWRADTDAELQAMDKAFDALYELPRDSRGRALRWLEARLDNSPYFGEPPF
jgi:hypothetical protein